MKSLWKRGLLILGGVILMTAAACTKEPIPDNRTKEQYELEQEFQPLFDFLAEEKKDFSNVRKYESTIIETDRKTSEDKKYSVGFDKLSNSRDGTYTITEDGEGTEYPVSITESSELSYSDSVPTEYNEEFFNLHLKKSFFEKLPISDYTAEHPETFIKSIRYDVNKQNQFEKIKENYHFSEISKTSLRLKQHYDSDNNLIYTLTLVIHDDKQSFEMTNRISFKD
ncbi:hypothetical protein AB3329_04300 [Streptococcus sp. H31]|uniref:hypothetical protein n=1 Tax=Streptococcus huangxiaojuni TaxID=3237239 RepID=UPI0034A0EEC2